MNVEALINWALHAGLDVSILIVVVLVCRRPFVHLFGARAAYALWALPITRLILPEIPITLPRPGWMHAAAPTPDTLAVSPIIETTASTPLMAPFHWHVLFVVLWLSGAFIWLAHQFWRQYQFGKLIRENSIPAEGPILTICDQAQKTVKLTRSPDVRMARTDIGPFVSGIFKPVIILPHNFDTSFNQRQQYYALVHELAHIKRGDLWAALGALIFRALNWPNPLVHICIAKFRVDQESACDAYVLNTLGGSAHIRQGYAATLVRSARLTQNLPRTPTRHAAHTHPFCLTIYHPLKERLMTIKTSKIRMSMLSRISVGTFLIAALTATSPITITAQESETPKTQTSTSKKVMKWVEEIDGIKTSKHIEILTEDGVTTAYNFDEFGNKTVIDPSELNDMAIFKSKHFNDDIEDAANGRDDIDVIVSDGDNPGEKQVRVTVNNDMATGEDGREIIIDGAGNNTFVVTRTTSGDGRVQVQVDDNVRIGDGPQASALVGAAQGLLVEAAKTHDGQKISAKARRKLEKAQKALKEAKEALEAEQ